MVKSTGVFWVCRIEGQDGHQITTLYDHHQTVMCILCSETKKFTYEVGQLHARYVKMLEFINEEDKIVCLARIRRVALLLDELNSFIRDHANYYESYRQATVKLKDIINSCKILSGPGHNLNILSNSDSKEGG